MNRWENVVERLVAAAIGDGDVSHLPAAGAPLPADDDAFAAPDMRLAFKIMRDNNVMPDWIAAGKALTAQEARLQAQIERAAGAYFRDLSAANAAGKSARIRLIQQRWERYQQEYHKRLERYNREALLYNLKLPACIPHKQALSSEALVEAALRAAEAGDKARGA